MSFSIQDFLLHALFPRLGKLESRHLLNWYEAGAMMGPSKSSERWISAMNRVTGVDDHADFTFKPFEHLWGVWGLKHRHTRAWCPDCYLDDLKDGQGPYDRLSWSVLAVKGCAVHRKLLDTQCHSCAQSDERFRSHGYQPGICGYCGAWLRRKRQATVLHPDSLEWWTAMSIEAILASASVAPQWDRARVAGRLQDVCNAVFDGRLKHAARQLQMSSGMLSDILSGRQVPSVDMLLRISYVCQIEVTAFWQPMSLDTQLLGPEIRQLPATYLRQTHSRAGPQSRKRMTIALNALLDGKLENINSWTGIARRIRVATSHLQTFAGENRKTISEIFAVRKRRSWALATSATKTSVRNHLREAATEFDRAGRPISRRALFGHLADRGVVLDQRAHGKVYSELLAERENTSGHPRRRRKPAGRQD